MTEPLVARLEEVWNDIAGVCDGLTAEEWNTPTECPGWTVFDNVAHMIGTERMLAGEQPERRARRGRRRRRTCATTSARPTNSGSRAIGVGVARKLLDEFRAVTARRLDTLRAMTPEQWDAEGFTPEGPGPYRQFMAIRVFDCWYHDEDIREAVGRPGFLEGEVADLSLGADPAEGPRLRRGEEGRCARGQRRGVHHRRHAARSSPRSRFRPRVARCCSTRRRPTPTAHITTDRRTFARLAGGRWTGAFAREHGVVRVEGDTALADRIVDNMAFTI